MKHYKFTLFKWGDGTTRLNYEDNEHGNDITIKLDADGTAYHCYYASDDCPYDDAEFFDQIDNLAVYLYQLVQEDSE